MIKRLDSRLIPDDKEEIRAFLVIRNEALRLPSTLRHHRSLGVHRFFVLDNNSTDGTLEYVLKQPDVHVFSTSERYSQSHYGVVWTNALLDRFGMGHWTLTIDADEQLIYPRYEQVTLRDFCNYLNSIGAEALPCLLLDMYSDRTVEGTVHNPQGPLLETCGFFDRAPYRMQRVSQAPYLEIYGGMRERLFKQIQTEIHAPTVSKSPLVKWKPGTQFLQSTHFLSSVKVAPMLAALLHFKFLNDFHQRAAVEVARGEHFANAREYRAYLQMLQKNDQATFICPESVKFRDSGQLVELGLMATSKAYETFAGDVLERGSPHHLRRFSS